MIPFSFQKGNKSTGCEDAPPKATVHYSIVCDGLGGAGATKHKVSESQSEELAVRTSGYLGARVVSESVASYYEQCVDEFCMELRKDNNICVVENFLVELKSRINLAIDVNMKRWDIKPSRSKTLKIFPTTLASVIYIPRANGFKLIAIWAGDSRVYLMTPNRGLQLLSVDDAKNSENEMNSTSEMTNCISHGNDYHINYALFDLDTVGIVFCCTDGCFDYVQSPLHFEWLLLHTILEKMPECKNEMLGEALANSICDNMYQSIGDDTTMAGVIIGVDSYNRLKELFKKRMLESEKLAVSMNECMKELKGVQEDKDSNQRKCRLCEGDIVSELKKKVCKDLTNGFQGSLLHDILLGMPSYGEYEKKKQTVEMEINGLFESDINKIQEHKYQLKNICRNMLVCDYMMWIRMTDCKRNSSLWGERTHGNRRKRNALDSMAYAKTMRAKQTLMTCIEVYKHPYYREINLGASNQNDENVLSRIVQLEELIDMIDNGSDLFNNVWEQAYFSTSYFLKERLQYDHSEQFEDQFDRAMDDPRSCSFISELTIKKIEEYNEQRSEESFVKEKYLNQKKKAIDSLIEKFWVENKTEIVKRFFSESEDRILEEYRDTDVPEIQLLSFVSSQKAIVENESRIMDIQEKVNKIWGIYKVDYQRFNQTIEKGVC